MSADATFDYVVIGAGAGGAVLGRRLADAGRSVALIEAGPSDEGRAEVADLGRYQEVLRGPLTRRLPITAPEAGNPRTAYPTAQVLGGGTSLNTCVWFRPPASDFLGWRKDAGEGWEADAIGTAFGELEERIGIEQVDALAEPH